MLATSRFVLYDLFFNFYMIIIILLAIIYVSFLQEGLSVLAKFGRPLLVHAEVQLDSIGKWDLDGDDPQSYYTYLKSRPPLM